MQFIPVFPLICPQVRDFGLWKHLHVRKQSGPTWPACLLNPLFCSEGTALPACFNILIFLLLLKAALCLSPTTSLCPLWTHHNSSWYRCQSPDYLFFWMCNETNLNYTPKVELFLLYARTQETVYLCTCVCAFFISDLEWFTQARCEDCCNGVSAAYWFHDEQMMSL